MSGPVVRFADGACAPKLHGSAEKPLKKSESTVRLTSSLTLTVNGWHLPQQWHRLQKQIASLECLPQTHDSTAAPCRFGAAVAKFPAPSRAGQSPALASHGLTRAVLSANSCTHTAHSSHSRRSSMAASGASIRRRDTSVVAASTRWIRNCTPGPRPSRKSTAGSTGTSGAGNSARPPQRSLAIWDTLSRELVSSFSNAPPQATKPTSQPRRVLSRPSLRPSHRHSPRRRDEEASVRGTGAAGGAPSVAAGTTKTGKPCTATRLLTATEEVARQTTAYSAVPSTASVGAHLRKTSQKRGQSVQGAGATAAVSASISAGRLPAGASHRPEPPNSRLKGSTETTPPGGSAQVPMDRGTRLFWRKELPQKPERTEQKGGIVHASKQSTVVCGRIDDGRLAQHQLPGSGKESIGCGATPKRGSLAKPTVNSSVRPVAQSDTSTALRTRTQLVARVPSAAPGKPDPSKLSATPHSSVLPSASPGSAGPGASGGLGRSRERMLPAARRSRSKRPPNVPKLDLRKCIQYRSSD
ncbi:hypothetical protein BESB_036930 [Besnoitia besnoiti]|uniref:Uncharacterized protein n=1 Tax=Besnoitia besnoiti TaxID=94643 RepID=A0A2A9MGZ0_BESBE|nr:hypothetical protein BESB_036930 [Besnoitia besnoiti]PFH37235.1 hypothetical protein BESB_036930 [Besnoitia besnoiti]